MRRAEKSQTAGWGIYKVMFSKDRQVQHRMQPSKTGVWICHGLLSLEVRGTCMEWVPKCRYCTQAEFCSCLGWQTKVGRFISAPAFGTFQRVRAANQMCCLSQRDRVLPGMDGSLYFPNLGGKGGKSKLASDSWKFLNLKSWRAMWNWYE